MHGRRPGFGDGGERPTLWARQQLLPALRARNGSCAHRGGAGGDGALPGHVMQGVRTVPSRLCVRLRVRLKIISILSAMHDLYLSKSLMRALRIIFKRTRIYLYLSVWGSVAVISRNTAVVLRLIVLSVTPNCWLVCSYARGHIRADTAGAHPNTDQARARAIAGLGVAPRRACEMGEIYPTEGARWDDRPGKDLTPDFLD